MKEPQKMKIKQAFQICKDIEALHKVNGIGRYYSFYQGYRWNEFIIRTEKDNSIIRSSRHEPSISNEFVPLNLWTILTGTCYNHKVEPLRYYVTIDNNGMFQSAPTEKNYLCSGLAARIIYSKMKREYKLAKKHQQGR